MTWFLVLLFVAAAAEAVWLDHRFEPYVPRKFRAVACHVAAGGVCCLLVVPFLSDRLLAVGTEWARFGVIMAVAFPALIYALLGGDLVLQADPGDAPRRSPLAAVARGRGQASRRGVRAA